MRKTLTESANRYMYEGESNEIVETSSSELTYRKELVKYYSGKTKKKPIPPEHLLRKGNEFVIDKMEQLAKREADSTTKESITTKLTTASNKYMAEEVDYIENGIVYCTAGEDEGTDAETDVDAGADPFADEEVVEEKKEEVPEEDIEASDETEEESPAKKYAVFVSTSKKYDITDPNDVKFIEEVEIPNRDEIANMKLSDLQDSEEYSSVTIGDDTYGTVKSASIYTDEDGMMVWEEL